MKNNITKVLTGHDSSTISDNKKTINKTGAGFLLITPVVAVILTALHLYIDGFMWQIWAMAGALYLLTTLSITGGYHRLFAHRAYESRTWLKWFWALFGAAAFQNSIYIWARDHRIHHRFVDTDLDPYSINKGFFYAHLGWMLVNEPPKISVEPYGRDLLKDPVVAFQHKYYVLVASFMCFILPMTIGYFMGSALGGLAVAGALRVVVVHHATFLINSWAHMWGKQNYTDTNTAKDSVILAVATMGEGYHNFHHYFANDYRNGIRWYHWDPTKWLIQMFRFVGGAHSLRRTPWSQIIKAQLLMEEKNLKGKLHSNWQTQFQTHLDKLKIQIHTAQEDFEKLREEYKAKASDYAHAKMENLEELKAEIRAKRLEMRHSLQQWREYHSFLLANVPG